MFSIGDGSTPAVLCHATGFCGAVLGPLATRLPDLRAVAPDLRGHGENAAAAEGGLSWRDWGDDALAAVDELRRATGIDQPVYGFGHSGGGAALVVAARARPGTFRALYLYEPVVFPPARLAEITGPNPLSEGARRRRPDFPSRQAAYDNFAAKPPMAAFHADALHAYIDHGFRERPDGTVTLKCRPEIEARCYELAPDSGAWEAATEVDCPVVVARGNLASGGPALFAEQLCERLPDASFETFDHLGHFGPLEAPADVAAAFGALIART